MIGKNLLETEYQWFCCRKKMPQTVEFYLENTLTARASCFSITKPDRKCFIE